jgi:transcriptional regulator with XRE-family HTH domain
MEKSKIGEKIKRLRNLAGLSQEEMAASAHIAHRSLQRIESGEANPTLDTLEAIAKGLKTTVEALISERSNNRPLRQKLTTTEERALAKRLIKNPESALFQDMAQILEQLLAADEERRALIMTLLFHDIEMVEPYLSDDTAEALSHLKAL